LRRIIFAGLTLTLCAATFTAASCRRDKGSPAETEGDRDISASLDYAGVERTYLLHLSPAYDGKEALPLLFAFHGGGGDGAGMEKLTHLSDIAGARGFLVAYPDGLFR